MIDDREGQSSDSADELLRRLQRSDRHLAKWRRRRSIEAWRLYDEDLPQYPAVIDVFGRRVHVRERFPTGDEVAGTRRDQLVAAVVEALDVAEQDVFVERRSPQHHGEGRGARANPVPLVDDEEDQGPGFLVTENGHRFWIVFSDRLDPGLFLDHRGTREWVAARSPGRRVLNLFCYTASFSVYAARAGAIETTSVDLSRRTLRWARRNFEYNGIEGPQHRLVRADCLDWLREQARDRRLRRRYDLVVLDPPTFSNSKAMRASFDVQRDHARLVADTMALVADGGSLVFSTNRRRFQLDPALEQRFEVRDIGPATLQKDFERTPEVHHAFHLRHRETEHAG